MYKLILVPLALDQGHGKNAMRLAQKLLDKDGKIVALHVIDQVPGYAKYYLSDILDEDKIQQSVEEAMAERIGDMPDVETVVLSGHPGREITDYAEKIGADCIIVGSHKPDIADYLLGSTAARIVRHAHCAVHVLR